MTLPFLAFPVLAGKRQLLCWARHQNNHFVLSARLLFFIHHPPSPALPLMFSLSSTQQIIGFHNETK
jgi:hypothetical protein